MKRNLLLILFGVGIVIIAGLLIMNSCGPRYGYNHMYGPGYGYGGGMMGGGHMYGYGGGMMGPGYGYGGDMMGFMRSDLQLTNEQARQLYDLAAKYRAKYYENRGNIQELEKIEQQHRKDIEKILMPEQLKIFNRYQRGFDRYGWFGGCPYH